MDSLCHADPLCLACGHGHGFHGDGGCLLECPCARFAQERPQPDYNEPSAALSWLTRAVDGAVLCVWNRTYNEWGLPGGKCEPRELPEQAQARELQEETGLVTFDKQLIFCGRSSRGRLCFVYKVRATGIPMPIEKNSAVGWMDREMLLRGGNSEFYRALLDSLETP